MQHDTPNNFLLFRPFLYSIRNRFFRGKHLSLRTAAVLGLGLLLFIALYMVSLRVIGYFHQQNELGIILSLKIFQMAWMIMFAMLIFSSMVSAVSSLYLSADNEILCCAPIREEQLFRMRFATSFLYTSWMMVIFSLPVFGAYGTIFAANWLIYPLLLMLAALSTALTANGIGLGATILLVKLFPAKRTKDIAVYLSLLFGILLYLVIRLLKPEELADPEKFPDFIDYLSSLQTPALSLLPSAWANQLLNGYLQDQAIDWLALGLLLLTPLILFWAGEWLMARFFFSGFSKAQESFGGSRSFARRPYHPSPLLRIFHKEAKLFLRDSSEWSQLFLIGALIVVYLYNFKALPLERTPMPTEYLTNLIAFANIGLAGFLATSLAARFVYPSISAEGPAFAMIRSSPLPLERYLACKYFFYCIPFTLINLVLIVASNALLQISGPMWWVSIAVSLVITWTALALALGFGAIYADFKVASRAAAQGSFGTIVFMFTTLALELLILSIGFAGSYRLVRFWLRGNHIDLLAVLIAAAVFLGIVLIAFLSSAWCLKKGIKSLER